MNAFNVPSPPARDHRSKRYPMSIVRKARLLYQGDWTIKQIIDYLDRTDGLRPSRTTIRCWVEPGFADEHRRLNSRAQARRRLKEGQNTSVLTKGDPDLTDEVLLALRLEDKLSHAAMCAVIARFYGVTLSVNQLRARLDRLGVPKNPAKVRSAARNLNNGKAAA